MSSQQPPSSVAIFDHPAQFPPALWTCFLADPQGSNIIYAHAAKVMGTGGATRTIRSTDVWIVCSKPGPSLAIEFVLACTNGPLGAYPVFIYTPLPTNDMNFKFMQPRLRSMVDALRIRVAPERVFSVFALDPVADAFASIWTAVTHISLAPHSVYYHARFMYCDQSTLKAGEARDFARTAGILRPAVAEDAPKVAELCYSFAAASEPFVLTAQAALYEATLLIRGNAVWVHTIEGPGMAPEVACIVATTRVTNTVAAITKVFTNPAWRSRGCAERLVRYVCEELLKTKQSVVLYVAHNNPAAGKVYERVGFVGFASSAGGSTDSWKELGFDQAVVQLGHW